MAALLLAWLLQDDPAALVRKLDEDRPEVRAAAERALAKLGEAAAEALEEGLKSPSLEVRGRVRALLFRLPSRLPLALRSHPDYAETARLWNAVIDAFVRKKPAPADLLGALPAPEADREEDDSEPTLDGFFEDLSRRGRVALERAVHIVGIEGQAEGNPRIKKVLDLSPDATTADLLEQAARAGADAAALEEIVATLLLLREELFPFPDEGLERVLVFLATARNRPETAAADPANAVDRLARGPWMEGLADSLGRAFANDRGAPAHLRRAIREDRHFGRVRGPWAKAAPAFDALLRIDAGLKERWFDPGRLRTAKPALPREAPDPERADAAMVARVRALGPLPPAAERVLLTILPTLPQDDASDLRPRLLRELCLRVAERVESGK